ncbi:unnamed protein product [Amoebophrya sp. A25]|nr:unnamed protein product [Amoebophrya sp. A25]|eukprot:GSA25T00004703001.1
MQPPPGLLFRPGPPLPPIGREDTVFFDFDGVLHLSVDERGSHVLKARDMRSGKQKECPDIMEFVKEFVLARETTRNSSTTCVRSTATSSSASSSSLQNSIDSSPPGEEDIINSIDRSTTRTTRIIEVLTANKEENVRGFMERYFGSTKGVSTFRITRGGCANLPASKFAAVKLRGLSVRKFEVIQKRLAEQLSMGGEDFTSSHVEQDIFGVAKNGCQRPPRVFMFDDKLQVLRQIHTKLLPEERARTVLIWVPNPSLYKNAACGENEVDYIVKKPAFVDIVCYRRSLLKNERRAEGDEEDASRGGGSRAGDRYNNRKRWDDSRKRDADSCSKNASTSYKEEENDENEPEAPPKSKRTKVKVK